VVKKQHTQLKGIIITQQKHAQDDEKDLSVCVCVCVCVCVNTHLIFQSWVKKVLPSSDHWSNPSVMANDQVICISWYVCPLGQ